MPARPRKLWSHALFAGFLGVFLQTGTTCSSKDHAQLSGLSLEVDGAAREIGFSPLVRGYDVPLLYPVMELHAEGRDLDARIEWSFGESNGTAVAGQPLALEVELEPGRQVLELTVHASGRKPGTYSLELNYREDGRACVDDGDCPTGEACAYVHPMGCFVGGFGGCVEVEQACQASAEPVCGCDGVTYESMCELRSAGVAVANLGACGCTSTDDCGEDEYCDARSCHGPGQCVARPTSCGGEQDSVLGCDGLEYDSRCAAAAEGQRVLDAGGRAAPPSPYVFMYLGREGDGDIELFTSRPGTSGATRINHPLVDARVHFAQWGAKGRDIAYSVLYDPNPFDIFYICGHCPRELFVASPHGTEHTKVSLPLGEGGRVETFSFAPDGEHIAYRLKPDRETLPELRLVRPDGSETALAHEPLGFGEHVVELAWSPDGTRIAFMLASTTEDLKALYTSAADGGDRRLVSQREPGVRAQVMRWSPDSTRLSYSVVEVGSIVPELFSGSADGSGYAKLNGPLVEGSEGVLAYTAWSPDGSRVMYRAAQDDPFVRHLYTTRADGSDNRRIGEPERYAPSQHYQWSPDGSHIAFLGYEDGERRLFVTDPTGTSRDQHPQPPDEGVLLQGIRWSPDSSRILIAARAAPSSGLEGYPLLISSRADGTDAHLVHPTPVTAIGSYAWSPDGTRVAYIADQDTPGITQIYTSAPDGSNNRRASHELPADADLRGYSWTPDAALVVYRVGDEIYSAEPDGSNKRRVDDPNVQPGAAWYWSPVPVPAD